MVPLNEAMTVLDLIARLQAQTILVSGTYLGAISHLLCGLDVLKQRDRLPCAIVLNESEGSTVAIDDMLETLTHFGVPIPLIFIPRQMPANTSDSVFDPLIDALKIA